MSVTSTLAHEGQSILELSENMCKSKHHLLQYIEFYHYEISDEYREIEFLIRSRQDLTMWIELFDGDPDQISQVNRKFRQWKIEQQMCDVNEFRDLLVLDPKDFVETVFVQCGDSRTLWELERSLGDMTSVDELYRLHIERPYSRIEYLL